MLYKQIGKDFIKRKYIDLVKGDRLKTAMQVQIDTLKFYDYLPRRIVAVELFGMHGLWITKDYAPQCAYLEFYEINHVYAMFAKKFIRNATVVEGDSIRAVLGKEAKERQIQFHRVG